MRIAKDYAKLKDIKDIMTITCQVVDVQGNVIHFATLNELTKEMATGDSTRTKTWLTKHLTILHSLPLHIPLLIKGTSARLREYITNHREHIQQIGFKERSLTEIQDELGREVRPEDCVTINNGNNYRLAIVNGGGLTFDMVASIANSVNTMAEAENKLRDLLDECIIVNKQVPPQGDTAELFPGFGNDGQRFYCQNRTLTIRNIERFCYDKVKDSKLYDKELQMSDRINHIGYRLFDRLGELANIMKESLPEYLHNETFKASVSDTCEFRTDTHFQPSTILQILDDSTENMSELQRRALLESRLEGEIIGYEIDDEGQFIVKKLSLLIRERLDIAVTIRTLKGQIATRTMVFTRKLAEECKKRKRDGICRLMPVIDKIASITINDEESAILAIKNIHRFVVDRENNPIYRDDMRVEKSYCQHTDIARECRELKELKRRHETYRELSDLRREDKRKEQVIENTRRQRDEARGGNYRRPAPRDAAFVSREEECRDHHNENGSAYATSEDREEARRLLDSISDPRRQQEMLRAMQDVRRRW